MCPWQLAPLTFKVPLIESVRMQVPFVFFSELERLFGTTQNETVRIDAFDSIVTVVEPEVSLLGGLVYIAYVSFGPKPARKSKKRAVPEVSASVDSVTATGAGGYREEWIPEHHLRKPKTTRTRKKSGALTSGDEFSELSASELSESAKKAKGKGRK
ncbi:hypothetical protein C8F01DRAFT_1246357 [Mycena amicta]|nr:hypothetical protein C8F01DRAFT_1246357 [Mycena amicta]